MFKKKMAILAMLACLGTTAHADTILGLTLSLDAWDMDSSGSISDSSDLQDFDLGSDTTTNFSLALEHPIPLIPNLKLRITDLTSSGDASLSRNFTFDGVTYPVSADVNVDFDLRSSDFVFYYELFDNDTLSFDLGLNAKYLDGDISVSDGTQSSSRSFKGVVPMLYGAVKVGIPTTRFSVFGDFNFLSVGDHTLRDFQAGAAYTLVESLAVDFSVRGGYRQFSLDLEDLDDVYADWTYDGLFLGVEADF